MPKRQLAQSTLGVLLALVGGLAHIGDARAAEGDAVALLPAGGTAQADVYSLDGSGDDVNARRTGELRLVDREIAPLAFTDFKLASERRRLLADAGDRGVLVTNADATGDYALTRPGQQPGVVSASVAGYGPRGVERILFAVSSDQRVAIHGRRIDAPLWSRQLVDPPVTTEIVQAIALPESRVAVAANWPTHRAGVVEIYPLDPTAEEAERLRFAGTRPSNASGDFIVDESLSDLRDLFGISSTQIVVATTERLVTLNLAEKSVEPGFSVTDTEEVQGDISAVVRLESGRYAITTVEPGVWTRPHRNHAVHWLDPAMERVIASAEGLDRAPLEVESDAGHGGSGTLDFRPGLDFTVLGSVETLRLEEPLQIQPDPPRRGASARATATIRNNGRQSVLLRRASLVAAPSDCPPAGDLRVLAERTDAAISPGSKFELGGTFRLDEATPGGTWCAIARVENDQGETADIGSGTTFDVPESTTEADAGGPSVADPRDLDLKYYGDTGDVGDTSTADRPGDGGGGCSCRNDPGSSTLPLPVAALLVGTLLAARRFR